MNKRPFGNTGLEVSPLGFGGGPVGYLGTDQQKIDRILNLLLDSGVNLIDTAECYHGSEESIGQAVGHRRDEFLLVTKTGHAQGEDVTAPEWTPELVTQTIDRSLRRLRTDRLDVVLLHSCDMATLRHSGVVEALIRAREAGKARLIGYSGDNQVATVAARIPEFSVVECSVSLADQANIDGVLPVAIERGMGVIAKRPLANSAWRTPSELQGIYAKYSEPYRQRLRRMGVLPDDAGVEGDDDSAWTEMALRFTLSVPGVSTAIVGTTDPDHAQENIRLAELGPLSAEHLDMLRGAFRNAEQAAREPWPALT